MGFTIDTAATIRDLEAAGIERHQAEAIAEGMRAATTADHAELATKTDIATLKTDIVALRSEVRWMFGFMFALVLAMAAKLFDVV